MQVGKCKETGEYPSRENRRQVIEHDKRGNEIVNHVNEGRLWTTAFDTGWIDLSSDREADIKAWNEVNPPPPLPKATGVVTNN